MAYKKNRGGFSWLGRAWTFQVFFASLLLVCHVYLLPSPVSLYSILPVVMCSTHGADGGGEEFSFLVCTDREYTIREYPISDSIVTPTPINSRITPGLPSADSVISHPSPLGRRLQPTRPSLEKIQAGFVCCCFLWGCLLVFSVLFHAINIMFTAGHYNSTTVYDNF
eukprot:GHVQ01016925.1.p1 GENE.GHVQ01016925.1~~GHVQ01016925.1.p1  ORF type:complete len:167 (+),score=21.69 GHVQ01016925.1:148-648(+)